LKNGGLKREGRAQKEKRGPSVSESGNEIETHEQAGDFKDWVAVPTYFAS
jgi:hypothetical protein